MDKKKLIQFRNIVKEFDGQIVLKGVNLDIYENEFVTLLGPSGCGKTTLLRILGGFLDATEGEVIFDGEDISQVPPQYCLSKICSFPTYECLSKYCLWIKN